MIGYKCVRRRGKKCLNAIENSCGLNIWNKTQTENERKREIHTKRNKKKEMRESKETERHGATH